MVKHCTFGHLFFLIFIHFITSTSLMAVKWKWIWKWHMVRNFSIIYIIYFKDCSENWHITNTKGALKTCQNPSRERLPGGFSRPGQGCLEASLASNGINKKILIANALWEMIKAIVINPWILRIYIVDMLPWLRKMEIWGFENMFFRNEWSKCCWFKH